VSASIESPWQAEHWGEDARGAKEANPRPSGLKPRVWPLQGAVWGSYGGALVLFLISHLFAMQRMEQDEHHWLQPALLVFRCGQLCNL